MDLRRWRSGDPLEATHLDEPVQRLIDQQKFDNGGAATTLPPSENIARSGIAETWLMKIVTAGPKGEADRKGCTYWLKKQMCVNDYTTDYLDDPKFNDAARTPHTRLMVADERMQDQNPLIVSGTNLEEWVDDTHNLSPGKIVFVFAVWARQKEDPSANYPLRKYIFWSGGSGIDDGFWAIVSSSALKSGCEARWDYGLTECTGNWTNDDKAQVLTAGRVVTGTNTIENPNPDSGYGAMGNGDAVTETEFDNNLKLQPIPNGTVVWVRQDKRCLASGSGTGSGSGVGIGPIYLFSAWNKKKICP